MNVAVVSNARKAGKTSAALAELVPLAVQQLRAIVDACPCGGRGETCETLAAHIMTDDARLAGGIATYSRWQQALRFGPNVRRAPLGAGILRTPCPKCAPLRDVIKTLEGPL